MDNTMIVRVNDVIAISMAGSTASSVSSITMRKASDTAPPFAPASMRWTAARAAVLRHRVGTERHAGHAQQHQRQQERECFFGAASRGVCPCDGTAGASPNTSERDAVRDDGDQHLPALGFDHVAGHTTGQRVAREMPHGGVAPIASGGSARRNGAASRSRPTPAPDQHERHQHAALSGRAHGRTCQPEVAQFFSAALRGLGRSGQAPRRLASHAAAVGSVRIVTSLRSR